MLTMGRQYVVLHDCDRDVMARSADSGVFISHKLLVGLVDRVHSMLRLPCLLV